VNVVRRRRFGSSLDSVATRHQAALNMLSQLPGSSSILRIAVSVVYPSVTATEFHQKLRPAAWRQGLGPSFGPSGL